jgi:hypothetical protein
MSKEYITFNCTECGKSASNHYSEPYYTGMAEKKFCFTCYFWLVIEAEKLERDHKRMTIINGCIYYPDNRTSGSFRGMAGRRFDIEYIEPSVNAGKLCTTFDLWYGGEMPEKLRARFPDTAKFYDGEGVDLGKGGIYEKCWNPATGKNDPFPLPKELDLV